MEAKKAVRIEIGINWPPTEEDIIDLEIGLENMLLGRKWIRHNSVRLENNSPKLRVPEFKVSH